MLVDLKHEKKVVGIKESKKYLKKDLVKKVIIGKDIDNSLEKSILDLAEKTNVQVEYADSMKILGKKAGINTKASIVALLK